jgi:hypothetical protein
VSIEILDADDPARLPSLGKPPPDPATCYLAALVARGPASYINDADVRMVALRIDERILPLVVAERIPGNSNVCSAYAHYYQYALYELAKRLGPVASAVLRAPRALFGVVLRGRSIDRIVFVNNWLLTTNPRHGVSTSQVAELTSFLTRRYPDRAIVFRSINSVSDPLGFDALRTNHYRMVPSRRVFVLETANPGYLERSNVQSDLAILRKTPYSIAEGASDLAPHAARFASLYYDLYCRKYSSLNPQYQREYFSLVLDEEFLLHRAFVKDGRVDAFVSFFVEGRVMTASLIAYDQRLPRKLGLYRMAVALVIAEAAKRGLLLNLSAGSGEFKMLRGAVPVQEYDAVYDHHLPAPRRLAWICVGAMAQTGRMFASRPRA